MPSNLPPPTIQGGLVINSSSLINAPKQKVWDILMDFPKYGEWNPALPAVAVLGVDKKPTPDQKPVVGQNIKVSMQIPPTLDPGASPTNAVELIIDVDNANYRFAWRSPSVGMMFRAERYIVVSEVEGKTHFEMRETFGGALTHIAKLVYQTKMQHAADEMAKALKNRSEQ